MTPRYIGVMTGNSMDAADAVLLDFSTTPAQLVESAHVPMPATLAERLHRLAHEEAVFVDELLSLQNQVSDLCAAAVVQLNAPPATVQAIGCHGQSIAHRPAAAATWQLLNGARLAEQTQIDVICDFRARDIASGGQGAPLAPFFHQYYFAAQAPCAIINIGGIANITHLSSSGDITAAYDIGPGMLLLDAWYRKHCDGAYDANSAFASRGMVNQRLLHQLLSHAYFSQSPPKSCGREEFSLALLPEYAAGLPPADVQATLLEVTAQSIAAVVGEQRVFLCGGGSANAALRVRLDVLLAVPPKSTAAAALPPQLVEAAAFAYLAKCHVEKKPLPAAAVTGGKMRLAGACYPR